MPGTVPSAQNTACAIPHHVFRRRRTHTIIMRKWNAYRKGTIMSRVREHMKVNGKKFWTLFDTGARTNYIGPCVAARLVMFKLPKT